MLLGKTWPGAPCFVGFWNMRIASESFEKLVGTGWRWESGRDTSYPARSFKGGWASDGRRWLVCWARSSGGPQPNVPQLGYISDGNCIFEYDNRQESSRTYSVLVVDDPSASTTTESQAPQSGSSSQPNEIDLSSQPEKVHILQPGQEYLVYFGAGGAKWTVLGNQPFEVETRGVRVPTLEIPGVAVVPLIAFPNPLPSGWMTAATNFDGRHGVYGKSGADLGATIYVVVRVSQPDTAIYASGTVVPITITIPFPGTTPKESTPRAPASTEPPTNSPIDEPSTERDGAAVSKQPVGGIDSRTPGERLFLKATEHEGKPYGDGMKCTNLIEYAAESANVPIVARAPRGQERVSHVWFDEGLGPNFRQIWGGDNGRPLGQLAGDVGRSNVQIPVGSVIVYKGHAALYVGSLALGRRSLLITYDSNGTEDDAFINNGGIVLRFLRHSVGYHVSVFQIAHSHEAKVFTPIK
ncbi:MAG: hypothetical protein HS111_09975 [Kofleriaceae bacterium]|nr:hypothetical protein [Kofleriaceae bacterium]